MGDQPPKVPERGPSLCSVKTAAEEKCNSLSQSLNQVSFKMCLSTSKDNDDKTTSKSPPQKKKSSDYQNVTSSTSSLEASGSLEDEEVLQRNFLHMQDKKAEDESHQKKQEQLLLKERTSLCLLSGGFVFNLMAAEGQEERMTIAGQGPPDQRVVVHHIHHHIHHHSPPQQPSPPAVPVKMVDNFYININRQLTVNKYLLEQCGWYHGALSHVQSTQLLSRCPQGTFLVRDSSHSRFLYTLSVQRGLEESPTSVRIFFSHGNFRLDADEATEHLLPKFNSILDLIEHYCHLKSQTDKTAKQMDATKGWVDKAGQVYAPICLRKPLLKEVPSLAHAARLAVHQCLRKSKAQPTQLDLPNQITNYLTAYPHVM